METKKFLDGEGLVTLWTEIASLQSDYNETDETSPNYIKNKPFTIDVIPEEVIEEFTFTTSDTIDSSTGLPTMQYVQLFSDLAIGQKMNLQFTYPELAAATGQPQYDDNGNIITKTVRYEDVEIGNFADAMGSQFLDSPAIMMGPGALIATLPESIQRVAIPNDDIVFVYSNATLANGMKTPLLITALMDWSTEGYSTYIANCSISAFISEKIDLIASRENHIALQSDWDEQNKENSAYIQNKPFGDEIVLTPKNEFYRDSFVEWYGDESSGFGNPGYSLQTEVGKQYVLTVYGIDGDIENITLTCIDPTTINGLTLPAGTHFLGDFDSSGKLQSLTYLVDNAKMNDSEEILYDESSCIIPFLSELYKIVIHDTSLEGTYERTIINKIDKKYLPKADQTYSSTSENAQSGIAVNEAISQFKNKLPSSVITSLTTPTTLGDQHVSVQWNNTNYNTSPNSATWDVYTTGIGLNSSLKTNAKNTIVNAINEIQDKTEEIGNDIETINTKLETIDIEKTTIKNVTNKLTSADGIIYKYDKQTKFIDSIIESTQDLDNGEIPQIIYQYLITDYADSNTDVLVATIYDGLAFLSVKENCIYTLTSKGLIKYIDFSSSSNSNWLDLLKSYTETYKCDLVATYSKNDDAYFFAILLPRASNKYYHFFISPITNTLYYKSGGYIRSSYITGGMYTPEGYYSEQMIESMSTASDKITIFVPNDDKTAMKMYSHSWTAENSKNMRNIPYFNSVGNIVTRIKRSIDPSGNENISYQSTVTSWYGSSKATENNIHSTYSIYKNQMICVSETAELLFRRYELKSTIGEVLKRVPLITTDIDFTDMQNCITEVFGDTLYIWQGSNLFSLDLTSDSPVINKLSVLPVNGLIKIVGNRLYLPTIDENAMITVASLKKQMQNTGTQPDWNQNNSIASTYIKNKPITAEYVTNYLAKDKSVPVAQQMGNEAFVVEDQFINLVVGEKYDIDMNVTSTVDNSTTTYTFKDVECVDMCGFWKQSSACPGIVIAPELMLSLYPSLSYATLSDSLVFMYTNNFNGAAYDETKCITCVGEIDGTGAANTNITITVNVSQTSLEGEISEPYAKFLQADWLERDEAKIGYIKNKPSTGDYYFFNLKDFADIGQATKQYTHSVKNPSSNVYNDYFSLNVVLGLGGMQEQTYYNITNIPYETLCINDHPYITDKHRFKNMGLKSPAFKQLLNYDGIVWFDAIEDCLRDILTDNFSSLYTITRQYSDMLIGFVIYGEAKRSTPSTMNPKVQQAIGLWDAVLNDPDTQIVIEYQNSQNVQHIEGQLIMPVAELEEVE